MKRLLCCCLLVLSLLITGGPVWATGQLATRDSGPSLPPGVEQSWWSKVQENLAREEYSIHWNEERQAHSSPNRSQNLRFTYRDDGFSVQPRVTKLPLFDISDTTLKEEDKKYQKIADWQIGFRVRGYGKGNVADKLSGGKLSVNGNRAEVKGDGLTVNYLNDSAGMRQDFIVQQRPSGNGPLQVGLDLETTLQQEISATGVQFRLADGQEVMKYNGLKVWDSAGRELAAHFRPGGQLCSLIIEVNDQDAVYPVTIDPLSNTAAWTAESNQTNANFGYSVSTAGDVNGDGYSDVIVGAYAYDNGQPDEGRAYAYHGSATGLATTASWSAESNQGYASFGRSVSTAGDVNGDGYSDVIVGAHWYDNVQEDEGRAFVYHGSATGLASAAAWRSESNQTGAYFGASVSTAGDVNGDGYSDVIVGAHWYNNDQTAEGRAFVYHGSATGLATIAAWSAEGDQANAYFGYSVSTAGDVNGDGYSDVIVGAYQYDNSESNEGRAFVFHGSATGLATTANWTAESNQTGAQFGYSVSTAGDVNGDGYSDVIVGAYQYDNSESNEGRAFVFHGSATGLATTANWSAESDQTEARFGRSVSTAGDVNGDGYSDVIVGAYLYDNGEANEGRAFVYHGSATGLATTANWSTENDQADAYFGISVSTAGDVNGDGYSDVIVGAFYYDNGETNEGRAFVYHGSATGLATTVAWTAESDQVDAYFGWSVSTAGDVNGDGYSDVIIGAHYYDNGQLNEGRAFVYHGSATGLAATAAWIAESNQASAYFGQSVSTAGDVNGDGYSDVIVGAYLYDNGQTNEGRAFVYHGSATGLATTAAWIAESDQAEAWFGYSVSTAGDVNGDGYSDVIIGAHYYDNGQSNEGRAFVYHGSATGLATIAAWIAESNQADAYFGSSVSTAGDVNGDGYSDVIVGAHFYDNGQTDEGRAFVYHGSATGLAATANWSAESNQVNAYFGVSVSTAGDVNGDGYSDVIVGAYVYDNGQTDEGGSFVYHGSATGLATTAAWNAESNQVGAYFGRSVSTAGDVNGDGYSDVIVGAYRYDNGQTDEGRVFVYHGSASGLATTANWSAESNQASAYFGRSVSTAGDVNGDGYSDVIVGAYAYDNGQSNEGRAFVYYGNGGAGLRATTQQYEPGTSNTISAGGNSGVSGEVRLNQFARSPFGRAKGRLVYEYKENGQPFSGATITNSTQSSGRQAAFTDLGTGVALHEDISGLLTNKNYKWRARVEYKPATTPHQKYGPWRYFNNYNAKHGGGFIAINIYTLTYTAGANGSITGTTPQAVNHGASGTEVTAVPATGYHFVNWSDGVTIASRTDSNVTANVTVTANFAINSYTLTYTAGTNGSITGTTSQTVNHGASGTEVTAVPAAGYHFVNWSDSSAANPRTDTNVTADITVTANFAINTYTLTYTAGDNGTISGTTPQTVNHGASGTEVTAVPAAGYHFVNWSDGVTTASRTDSNVTANVTVTANFAINSYTLTYTAGANGSITGTTPQTVNHGASGTEVTAVPEHGYLFVNWSDGVTTASRTDSNVTANVTVTANFAINTYTLTYTAGANGSIAGTTPQTVNHGASGTEVTAVPEHGYLFVNWSDGVTTASRTDTNVTADITVTADFVKKFPWPMFLPAITGKKQ